MTPIFQDNFDTQPRETMTLPNSTPIFEEDDCCAKCGGTERVGKFWEIPICVPCFKDKATFKPWFMDQMEDVLRQSPEYEQSADGKWRKKL